MLSILTICLVAAPVPAEDWTPRTFRVAKPKEAGPGAVAVAVSADGKFVAAGFNGGGPGAGGSRGTIRVWEVETGKLLMAAPTQMDILKVAFGPGGKSVAWGRLISPSGAEGNSVFVRGFGDNLFTRGYESRFGAAFAVTPDGKQLAVGVFDRVQVRDIVGDKTVAELKAFPRGYAFAFTPDGKQLVGARLTNNEEYQLVRSEVESGKVVAESEKLPGLVYAVAVSPDGKQAATGHDYGAVRMWDANWKALRTFAMKTEGRAHPFFSSDGKFLAAGDQTSGEVVVWERESGKEVRRFVFEQGAFKTTFTRTADAKFRPETDPVRFAFTPGGKTLLVGCNGVQLLSLAEGRVIRTFNLE